MTRFLFSTFGSAGDLFPVLAVARHLEHEGHEVVFAAPRSLGLYLRSVGMRCYALGTGSELSVVQDDALFTTRFDGWESQRRTMVGYVGPALANDVAHLERAVDDWQPDLVVTTSYATAARVVALSRGIPHVPCTIYPDQLRLLRRSTRFAMPYQAAVRSVTPSEVLDEHGFDLVAWGVDSQILLLHDPLLLGPAAIPGDPEVVGYPYWDDLPTAPDEAARLGDWLADASRPAVAVTLGSFIGVARGDIWDAALAAARSCGARLVIVNAREKSIAGRFADVDGVLTIGFVPLSRWIGRVDAVIHHGGLGTTMATVAAGRPAVVVPQAFDQTVVATQIERAGLGVRAAATDLTSALRTVLGSPDLQARAQAGAAELIPPAQAAARAAERVLGRWATSLTEVPDPTPGRAR